MISWKSIKINKCGVLVLLIFFLILIHFWYNLSSSNQIFKNTKEINLRKVLIGSIEAAQHGGLEIVEISKFKFNKTSKGKTKEGADDPVTEADFRSHCVMKNGLHRLFSKLVIISEEDQPILCNKNKYFDLDPTVLHDLNVPDEIVDVNDLTVWIDPLDATQEFTEHLYKFVTTMVCVAYKGTPIIGVIHDPFKQTTTWAWVGKIFSRNLDTTKDIKESTNPVITVSRSHSGNVKNISKSIFGENSRIIVAAGAGYKVLQVVFGEATAYFHTTNIKKWDLCAGDAILRAVGGKMTTLNNEEIKYLNNSPFINNKGVLATLSNHDAYIDKLSKLNSV